MDKQNEALKSRPLNSEELEQISKLYDRTTNFIRMGPKGYFLEKRYEELAADIYNMEIRDDDIFVASVQRSGTTWTQELVWMIANDLNYEKSAAIPLTKRYPFLEFSMYFNEEAVKLSLEGAQDYEKAREVLEQVSTPTTEVLPAMPSPRFIKTHLPMSLLNPNILDKAKVVYVARDPRDVAVSCFFLAKWFKVMRYKGSFKDMWRAFINHNFSLLPFFEHVKEAWNLRHHPNMLFLFYEELSKDMSGSIGRVAKFLGKELTPAQTDRLCDHLSFDNFKNNQSVNFDDMKECGFIAAGEKFIRKGKSGGWRDYFDEEMEREAEKWIADNLRDTDLTFPSMKNIK